MNEWILMWYNVTKWSIWLNMFHIKFFPTFYVLILWALSTALSRVIPLFITKVRWLKLICWEDHQINFNHLTWIFWYVIRSHSKIATVWKSPSFLSLWGLVCVISLRLAIYIAENRLQFLHEYQPYVLCLGKIKASEILQPAHVSGNCAYDYILSMNPSYNYSQKMSLRVHVFTQMWVVLT